MSPEFRKVVDTLETAQRVVPALLKEQIGQGAHLIEDIHEADQQVLDIGITSPHVARDPRTGEGSVSLTNYSNVGAVKISEVTDGYEIILPDRDDVEENVETEKISYVYRAEVAFVDSAQKRIAKSPIVQIALNPVKEILVAVTDLHEVPVSQIPKPRYLPLLKGLNYLEEEDGAVYPGPMLQEFETRGRDDYEAILGDVIAQGYDYLVNELRVRHLITFVRAANAYFLPSYDYGQRLRYTVGDFDHYLRQLYSYKGYKLKRVKLHNHLNEMTQIGIFQKDDDYRVAKEALWEDYEDRMRAQA